MNFKRFSLLVLLIILFSIPIVSAGFLGFGEENEEVNFEITPLEGYSIDHTAGGKIYLKEDSSGDLITIFEVNGNTSVPGYENEKGTFNPKTLETSDFMAYKTHDQQKTGNAGATILRTEIKGHDFQLVWEHDETVNFDDSMFEKDIDVLNQTAKTIKMK